MYPQNFHWETNDEEADSSRSSEGTEPRSDGLSTGAIVGIVVSCLVVVALVGGLLVWKRNQRTRSNKSGQSATAPTSAFQLMGGDDGSKGNLEALIHDPIVIAARIPLNLIEKHALIGKGGFGQVYKGTYMNQEVAIKRLPAEHRKSIIRIEGLLSEVKMMSTMDIPNIVTFIGVAWNALTDLCLVVEYMGRGDLRSLLMHFEKHHRPQGLDGEKLRIAKEIANGLTYLHSLEPKVLHRDLKSGNVLLTDHLDAKLTDFGISRESSTQTMTAGIGSSLWMAPEVMMGGRYDETADIFSFGVVLSELDTHELPYAAHKVHGSGRTVPDAFLLDQVRTGKIQAAFSSSTSAEVLSIARRCLSLDPQERPSAAEVTLELYSESRKTGYSLIEGIERMIGATPLPSLGRLLVVMECKSSVFGLFLCQASLRPPGSSR